MWLEIRRYAEDFGPGNFARGVTFWLIRGRRRGHLTLALHRRRAGAKIDMHDHGGDWLLTLVLAGGYTETVPTRGRIRKRRPGSVALLRVDDRHALEMLPLGSWSAFAMITPWHDDPEDDTEENDEDEDLSGRTAT